MKVLLLSTRPLGATDIDRVLLTGLSPSAVDVCPSATLALARLDTFTPDLIIVNLPEAEAGAAIDRLREQSAHIPMLTVAPAEACAAEGATLATRQRAAMAAGAFDPTGAAEHAIVTGEVDLAARSVPSGDGADAHTPPLDARITDAVLAEARGELDQLARGGVTDALDVETRWLLYEVASIGHVSTTPHGDILAANDVAAQLLGHFSPSTLESSGLMPRPLLDAAGPFARRPSRFELCLQHGADGPLHWIVGLALPQGGIPATVTWFLIDVSEQRLQSRRARFLRRMEALTHVLSAATAECTTLVDTGSRALTAARASLPGDVEIEEAVQALSRTQAVLAQLAGFARRRARRPGLRDLRTLIEQISAVLVHVAGDEITWSMDTGDQALYASIDASELEQCLSGLVTQGREALPLGGRMRLALTSTMHEAPQEDGRGTRPEIRITIEAQGYGLQPITTPPMLQTQVARMNGDLAVDAPDHLSARMVLRLPRVLVTG